LELVGKLDFLGDGNAVLGDARGTERLVDDDVAALGAERHLHRVGEDVDAVQHALARVTGEFYVFGSHYSAPGWLTRMKDGLGGLACDQPMMPMMSDSFMIRRSSPLSFTSVPDHLPNKMRSPALTSSGTSLPASSRAPEPPATISPSCGFSCAVSGMMMPPAVFASASTRRTTTRSCNGRKFMRSPFLMSRGTPCLPG